MSICLGQQGTSSKREFLWVALLLLLIVLGVNHAFGMPGKPKPLVRQPKTPVVKAVTVRCLVKAGVPQCVTIGTFPDNPNWKAAFGR